MINGEHTHHHLGVLRNFLQSGVVHATSLNGYNLLFLILLTRTLTRHRSLVVILPRWHTAVMCKVPQITTIVIGVVVGGVELVALKAFAAVSESGVPTAAVAVVV